MDSITECAPTNTFDSNALLPPAPTVPPEGRRNSRVRIEIPTGTAAPDTEIEANNAQRKSISDSVRSWRSSLKESCNDPTGHHSSLPAALSTERATAPGRNSIWTLSTFFNSSRRSSEGAKSTLSRSRAFSSSGRAERRLARRTGDTMDTRMVQKRTIIRRQLRQVFVYPVVYICLWLMPFVALCVMYNTHYARRPPFVVNALNNFCLCFIGAVNAVVFSWREKPWRHIQSNPTRRFWSSFRFWRHYDDEDEEYARQQSQRRRSSANSKRWSESTYVESAAAAAGGPPNVFSPPLPQPPPPSSQRPQPAATTTASPLTRPSPVPLQQQQHPSIPVYYADDDDAITPLQSPPQAFFPRKESATSSAPPRPLVPPALISRTSFPPLLHLALDLPPSSSSPTSSVGSAGMGTSLTALARRGLKRASIMATSAAVAAAAAAGSGEASTDAQKAARELAYERLAWERREQRQRSRQQSQRLEGQLGGRRMSRRVSTGDLAGAVGAAGGYCGGGGSLPVVAGPVPGTVGRTREWWEGGGSRGGGGASPGWCSEGEGESP
ncbi:Glucose receptor Git3 [Botryosphaeria dothidea]|uniref:Glucose receptor Git3 n=1 Tax=Botryosphaeria dothidea TaxID=55169 RepID=A0A8H4N0V2_9PEZI|nr:Glucose receptor Git3 [Botryosphaeria dothidea]